MWVKNNDILISETTFEYMKMTFFWRCDIALYLSITHRDRVTQICVSKLTTIGSDNCLSSDRRQAIIWTNARILLIERLRANFSGILIEFHIFSFKKIHWKMSSGKWQPFCLGFNVINVYKFLSNPNCCNVNLDEEHRSPKSTHYDMRSSSGKLTCRNFTTFSWTITFR